MNWEEFNRTFAVDWQSTKAGGFAKVFRGVQRRLNMEVVFKELKQQEALSEMLHEVEVLKRVKHHCLPQVLDAVSLEQPQLNGQITSTFFSVIEYIPGDTLNEYIRKNGPAPWPILSRWSDELCSALSALHNCTDRFGQLSPIIHADIKPDNIIVRQGDLTPMLIDFNIAATTSKSALMGLSKRFSPPELVAAFEDINRGIPNNARPMPRTDLYSMGTVLYFAATGGKIFSYEYPDWQALTNRGVPETWITWLQGLLVPDPNQRFQNVQDAWQALRQVVPVAQELNSIQKNYKKSMILLAAGALLGVLILCAGIVLVRREATDSFTAIHESWSKQIDKGDYEEAAAEANRMEEIAPGKLDSYICAAQTRYLQGDYQGTVAVLEKHVIDNSDFKNEPGYHDALKLYADSLERINSFGEARAVYSKMESLDLMTAADYRDYAALLAENKEYNEANKVLSLGNADGLSDADIKYVDARSNRAAGNKQKAQTLMTEATNTATNDDLILRAGRLLAIWQIEDDKSASAVQTLEFVINNIRSGGINPELSRLLAQAKMNVAASTQSDLDITSALAAIDQIVSKNWDTADVWNAKATFECALGKFDNARKSVDRMEDKFGSSRMSAVRRALVEYEAAAGSKNANDYKAFSQAYELALKTEGSDNDADYQLMLKYAKDLKAKGLIK